MEEPTIIGKIKEIDNTEREINYFSKLNTEQI